MRGRFALLALSGAFAAFALAPALASAAPVPNDCTQDGPAAGDGTTEWTCWVDPEDVAGYEVEQKVIGNIPKPPVDGSITHMETDVVDAATGTPVPISRLMLHHIVYLNLARPDAGCGGPERFYGAGEERLKMSFPDGYGYPYKSSNSWLMVYMFMNHRATTDDALIQYKLTVAPESAGLTPVRSYWMDAGNCETDPIYNVRGIDKPDVPNCSKAKKSAKSGGRGAKRKASKCKRKAKKIKKSIPTDATDVRTKDVKVKEDGVIVAGAGHVHGGAKELTITKPDCNNVQVAESKPTWGNPDHPFYNVKPVLHEPGPIGMSGFNT